MANIGQNQYNFLSNLINTGTTGQQAWAKDQLANSSYTLRPSAPKSTPTNAAQGVIAAQPSNASGSSAANWQDLRSNVMNQPAPTMPTLPSMPNQRPTIDFAQAQQQAQQRLGYQYDKMKTDTLQALKNDMIRRGLFGQTDAGQIEYNKAADLEAQKQAAIANLANSILGQDQQAAGQEFARALDQYKIQRENALAPYEEAQRQYQQKLDNLIKLNTLINDQQNNDRNFNYKQQRDQVGDNQWQQTHDLQMGEALGNVNGQDTLQAKQLAFNQELAKQKQALAEQRAARASSGGRSGGFGKMTKSSTYSILSGYLSDSLSQDNPYVNVNQFVNDVRSEAQKNGWDLKSSIDAAYNAYTNGKYPTKSAFDKAMAPALKAQKEFNSTQVDLPDGSTAPLQGPFNVTTMPWLSNMGR